MKITTADCVKAIIKYFYEKDEENLDLMKSANWKRRSKSGTGNNIVRTFENTVTKSIMKVISSEDNIFKVSELAVAVPYSSTTSNIKQFLRENIINAPEEFWNVHYDIFGEDNVVNWPQVELPPFEEGDKPELEPLDMENFEWLSVTDDEVVICCGGDWQEPLTLTIRLINGKLTVINKTEGYEEGMSEEELLKAIQ